MNLYKDHVIKEEIVILPDILAEVSGTNGFTSK